MPGIPAVFPNKGLFVVKLFPVEHFFLFHITGDLIAILTCASFSTRKFLGRNNTRQKKKKKSYEIFQGRKKDQVKSSSNDIQVK